MVHPYAIAGIAVGGLLLFDQRKKSAGKGLVYISDYFRARGQVGGVSFIPPSSASAVETFQAMRDAQQGAWGTATGYPKPPDITVLRDICQAWLDAFAGACAQSTGAVTGSAFDATAFNLSMLVQRLGGSAVPATCSTSACSDPTLSKALSPLGTAVCALQSYVDTIANAEITNVDETGAAYVSETYARVERLANELDAADYTVPGNRASDSLTSIGDIPGEIAGAFANAFLGSPLVWAGGLALVAWMVLK